MRIVARSAGFTQWFRRWSILLLAALPLSACNAFPARHPEVQLLSIQPESVGLVSQTFLLSLKISNPHDGALHAKAGEARLYVQDRRVAYGLLDTPVDVPAYGSTTVQIPVTGNFLPLLGDLGSTRTAAGLPYTIKGYLVMGLFDMRVPFEVKGALHVPLSPRPSAVLP
ncbi:LEA type 2 family protein [Acidithiobacillus ferrianus]|uniref:LEA type 2 family protein n=1 Tax=Acidithiobacillus ferrianus TaxID=2678518 RepID=UPI0034E4D673